MLYRKDKQGSYNSLCKAERSAADCFSFPLNAADLAAIVFLGFNTLKRPSVMLSGVSSNTKHIPITAVSIARILNTTVVSPFRFKFP